MFINTISVHCLF